MKKIFTTLTQKGKQFHSGFNTALRTHGKQILHSKSKGMTLIEVTIVMLIFAALIAVGAPAFSKSFSRANETQVLSDFAKIQVAATEFLHEQPDTISPARADGILALNEYMESNFALVKPGGAAPPVFTMQDPWGEHYQIDAERGLTPEDGIKITVTSVGSGTEYKLLVHYKEGEIRVGTAGFRNNMGSAFSDATNTPTVSITDMWAKTPLEP